MKPLLISGLALVLLVTHNATAAAQDKEKVAGLIADLKSGDSKAAYALGEIGAGAKEAIPALIAALDTEPRPGEALPDNAAVALAKIGPASVPALIEVLKSNKTRTWAHAANALKQLGPLAKEAVPALTAVVKTTDHRLTLAVAIDALGAIGSHAKSAVPQLLDVLGSKKEVCTEVWTHAVVTLGKIGPDAKAAVPMLQKLRDKAPPSLRIHIDEAVELIGAKK
jgi:HEAT repeat protein